MGNHIAKTAKIGRGCTFGHNIVILDDVEIGDNVYIGHSVVIHERTKIGNSIHIEDGSILGRVPKLGVSSRWNLSKELPPLEIGDSCLIGTNAVIYTGTKIGKEVMIADLASVREQNIIGDRSIIGRTVLVEPQNEIGA